MSVAYHTSSCRTPSISITLRWMSFIMRLGIAHCNILRDALVLYGYWKLSDARLIWQELLQLEEDVKLLEEMYPQGEKVMYRQHVAWVPLFMLNTSSVSSLAGFIVWIQAETSWALTILGYLAKLVLGILGWVLIMYLELFWMIFGSPFIFSSFYFPTFKVLHIRQWFISM